MSSKGGCIGLSVAQETSELALNAAVESSISVQRQEAQRHLWTKKLGSILAGTIAAAPLPPPASFLCYEC
eukprot:1331160-Pyramimonas_sp.AAC.1